MNNPNRCRVGFFSYFILPLTLAILLQPGCYWQQSIKGKGEQTSASADLEPFSRLGVDIPADVQIHLSDRFHYEIEGYQNIVPLVDFTVKDNQLKIISTKNIGTASRIILHLPENLLTEVSIAGAAVIKVNAPVRVEQFNAKIAGSGSLQIEVETQILKTQLAGSGRATFSGSAERHDVNIVGSGTVQATSLDSQWAQVKIAGSGDARIKVARQLLANIVGSGNVYLSGNPDIDSSTLGSGKVIPTQVLK